MVVMGSHLEILSMKHKIYSRLMAFNYFDFSLFLLKFLLFVHRMASNISSSHVGSFILNFNTCNSFSGWLQQFFQWTTTTTTKISYTLCVSHAHPIQSHFIDVRVSKPSLHRCMFSMYSDLRRWTVE